MNKNIISRINVYLFFFFIAISLVIIRILFYQDIFLSEKNKASDHKYTKIIKAKRGEIITSDNFELALDLEYEIIKIDPVKFDSNEEIEEMVDIISNVVKEIDKNSSIEKIKELKEKERRDYNFKGILITKLQKEEIQNKVKEKKKENKNLFKNKILYFEKVFKRKYIDEDIFSTIVGYLNNENKGVYGLEHKYDEYLKGMDGKSEGTSPFVSSNAEYTLPYLIDEKILIPEKPGDNIIISINSILQYSLDEVLKTSYEKYSPVASMGIVMEVDTGRILAMSSYPKAKNKAEIKNLNITSLFEPGSIFKPLTVSAAINEGKINENTLIHSDGFIKVKNRIIRDHDNSTKGTMPVSKIIAHSGNVGLVKISQMLDSEIFYNYLKEFGLGEKTGVDISYETNLNLMPLKNFTEVRRSNVSFGQGISMTQLQIMVALNATINGGKVIEPRVVDKIVDQNGNVVKQFETVVKNEVITEKTSNQIRNMLEKVVDSGTGQGIKLDGYRIGGKTGTAQKAGAYGYEAGKYFSSFYTFFPVDKPKYAILVTLDEPKGSYYGAAVSLPVAKDILEKIIKRQNILPTEIVENKEKIVEEVNRINRNTKLDEINNELSMSLMSNFKGVTRKNLMSINNLSKYNVKITGNGKVVNQFPEVGTVLKEGDTIRLELK